jgi:hypothetical protein
LNPDRLHKLDMDEMASIRVAFQRWAFSNVASESSGVVDTIDITSAGSLACRAFMSHVTRRLGARDRR